MKNLVIQTYITDNIDRGTKSTYKQFPTLERLSKKSVRLYAESIGADYEFCEKSDNPNYNTAHWLRMEMFNRPEYDNVLYVDCDVVVNKAWFKKSIFDLDGVAVRKVWAYPICHQVPGVPWPDHPDGMFNAGVMKMTKEQCAVMKEHIDKYYHPTHNQPSLNACFHDHIGQPEFLPYRWNVTHRPSKDVAFRHFPGMQKQIYKKDPVFKQWK